MAPELENPDLLCQDCDRKLFRWFLSRIDSARILRLLFRAQR